MENIKKTLSVDGFTTVILPEKTEEEVSQTTSLIVQQILQSDLNKEGLLRTVGTGSTINILNQCTNEDLPKAFKHPQVKVEDLVGLLKLHLKENPIFTPEQFSILNELCASNKVTDQDISDFIAQNLSDFNKNRLIKVAELIKNIVNHSNKNKMTQSNINISFSPTFLIPTSSGGTVLEDAYDRQSVGQRKDVTNLTFEEGLKHMQEESKRQANNVRLLNVILNKYS